MFTHWRALHTPTPHPELLVVTNIHFSEIFNLNAPQIKKLWTVAALDECSFSLKNRGRANKDNMHVLLDSFTALSSWERSALFLSLCKQETPNYVSGCHQSIFMFAQILSNCCLVWKYMRARSSHLAGAQQHTQFIIRLDAIHCCLDFIQLSITVAGNVPHVKVQSKM